MIQLYGDEAMAKADAECSAVWNKAYERAMRKGYDPCYAHHCADLAVERYANKLKLKASGVTPMGTEAKKNYTVEARMFPDHRTPRQKKQGVNGAMYTWNGRVFGQSFNLTRSEAMHTAKNLNRDKWSQVQMRQGNRIVREWHEGQMVTTEKRERRCSQCGRTFRAKPCGFSHAKIGNWSPR